MPVWGRQVRTRAAGREPPKFYWDETHWSYTGGQFGDGRERAASEFARSLVDKGDPDGFLKAIDEFHSQRREHELIHVGPKKGAWLDAAVKNRAPRSSLEFGTQIGYSAIRIARLLPQGSKLWTVEPNPDNVEIARDNFEFVGLQHVITLLPGTFEDVWRALPPSMDLIFLDHSRASYLRELHSLQRWGYIMPGTVVIADNIGGDGHGHGHAKAAEYAAFVRQSGQFTSSFFFGDDDGIEISEAIARDQQSGSACIPLASRDSNCVKEAFRSGQSLQRTTADEQPFGIANENASPPHESFDVSSDACPPEPAIVTQPACRWRRTTAGKHVNVQ